MWLFQKNIIFEDNLIKYWILNKLHSVHNILKYNYIITYILSDSIFKWSCGSSCCDSCSLSITFWANKPGDTLAAEANLNVKVLRV